MQAAQTIKPWRTFEVRTHWVKGIIHLPGGKQIMACCSDATLRIWNLQTGQQVAIWPAEEIDAKFIALSPDGKNLAVGGWDGLLRLWDIGTEKVIQIASSEQLGVVTSVPCWNRDGRRVMVGCHPDTVKVWDMGSKKTVLEIKDTGLSVLETVYSPDTTMIATGGKSSKKDVFIKIWGANTGKLITNLKGHTGDVSCLTWTRNSLISGSRDCSIRIWNTTTWQQITVLTGHANNVTSIAVSPDGRIFASASWDNTARLWNLDDGQLIGLPFQHANRVGCVSFSKDGKLLATGCFDNNAYTWDVSVIVREGGLHGLLNVGATRQPVQRPEDTRRLPSGFFDDSPHHPDLSRTHRPATSPALRDTPPPLRFLKWARNPIKWLHRQKDERIELQQRRSAAVDVPLGYGEPRYYSANELRIKKRRQKEKAKAAKNASASHRQGSSITRKPTGLGQPHATGSPSSVTPPVTSPATSLPNTIVSRSGSWIRFIFCTSTQVTDN